MIRLSDLNIHDIGNGIDIAGVIYSGKGKNYICYFPGSEPEMIDDMLVMDLADWQKFLLQTDTLETEALVRRENGTIEKAIVRKSQRQIDSRIMWHVFKRDNYKCCY